MKISIPDAKGVEHEYTCNPYGCELQKNGSGQTITVKLYPNWCSCKDFEFGCKDLAYCCKHLRWLMSVQEKVFRQQTMMPEQLKSIDAAFP